MGILSTIRYHAESKKAYDLLSILAILTPEEAELVASVLGRSTESEILTAYNQHSQDSGWLATLRPLLGDGPRAMFAGLMGAALGQDGKLSPALARSAIDSLSPEVRAALGEAYDEKVTTFSEAFIGAAGGGAAGLTAAVILKDWITKLPATGPLKWVKTVAVGLTALLPLAGGAAGVSVNR